MNAHIPVDCGFVRVPRSYLTLPISPGAKALLLFLCSAANERGESWHPYSDIATLLGRSKSSIAAYVRELVEIGLVDAIEQKTANGYNYRRRLKLIQWRSFLDYWKSLTSKKKSTENNKKEAVTERKAPVNSVTPASSEEVDSTAEGADFSAPSTERSVQPAACKDPSGPINNIHQNKTHLAKASVVWSDEDEKAWRKFRPSDSDPLSVANGAPDANLVEKLRQMEQQQITQASIFSPAEAQSAAEARMGSFVERHRLENKTDALLAASKALASIANSQPALDAAMQALEDIWKPFWRQIPSPKQIEISLKEAASKAGPSSKLKASISRTRMRIWVANMHSGRTGGADSKGPKQSLIRTSEPRRIESVA